MCFGDSCACMCLSACVHACVCVCLHVCVCVCVISGRERQHQMPACLQQMTAPLGETAADELLDVSANYQPPNSAHFEDAEDARQHTTGVTRQPVPLLRSHTLTFHPSTMKKGLRLLPLLVPLTSSPHTHTHVDTYTPAHTLSLSLSLRKRSRSLRVQHSSFLSMCVISFSYNFIMLHRSDYMVDTVRH